MVIRTITNVEQTFRLTLREVAAAAMAIARSKGQVLPAGTMTINGTLFSGHEGDQAIEIKVRIPMAVSEETR